MRSLGFHNRSDDSVSSLMISESERDEIVGKIQSVPTIDHIWTRDNNGNVDWQWERLSANVSITRERITLTDFPYIGWVTRKH